jgi:hypothetical protein
MALLALVLAGAILSIQSNSQNDVQDTQLAVLKNNITYLDMEERITAENVTNLSLRVATLLTQINVLLLDINATSTDIFVLNATLTDVQVQLNAIYTNLTIIQSILVGQQQNLTASANATDLLQQEIAAANATLYAIIEAQLISINGVVALAHNIDLIGACGVIVYPSFFNSSGAVTIDACALQAQILALTVDLNNTIAALFRQIVMSNTTIGSINGQYPISGNMVIEAGLGIAIGVNSGQTNGVDVNNTGIQTINTNATHNVLGDIQFVAGANFSITPGTAQLTLTPTADHIGVVNVSGGIGITVVTAGPNVTVKNTFSDRVLRTDGSSYTCSGVYSTAAETPIVVGTLYQFYNGSLSGPCKYGSVSSPLNLNDTDATFLVYMHWNSSGLQFLNGDCNSNYREEFYYCIGPVNCASNPIYSSAYVTVRAAIKKPVSYGRLGSPNPPLACTTVIYSYVATIQTESVIPVTGNYLSFGWSMTDLYAEACPTRSFTQGFSGNVILQRIG